MGIKLTLKPDSVLLIHLLMMISASEFTLKNTIFRSAMTSRWKSKEPMETLRHFLLLIGGSKSLVKYLMLRCNPWYRRSQATSKTAASSCSLECSLRWLLKRPNSRSRPAQKVERTHRLSPLGPSLLLKLLRLRIRSTYGLTMTSNLTYCSFKRAARQNRLLI